jgi:hypothetical protein
MKTQVDETRSEFGKGLAYCLGLFLAHADRFRSEKQTYKQLDRAAIAKELHATYSIVEAERWFSGASEHLYGLQVEVAPKVLRKRLATFRDKCVSWGRGFELNKKSAPTKKDFEWAIREAKDLLFELDRLGGVKPIKATYE